MHELTVFLIAQICFCVGFALGRVTSGKTSSEFSESSSSKSTVSKQARIEKLKSVKIDEAKFVTNISFDALKKSGQDLGNNSVVDDDIGSSVSKLAQLKRGS